MKFSKKNIADIKAYRTLYFNSLCQFQELYLELMVNNADCYVIEYNDVEIAYAIASNDHILLEFYVLNTNHFTDFEIFCTTIKSIFITEVYCKSFDTKLLKMCEKYSNRFSEVGCLYRRFTKALISRDNEICMHEAQLSDASLLNEQDSSIHELFETEKQLFDFIANKNVFIFRKNNHLLGVGTVIRTHSDWSYCDLGVWVQPTMRGRGWGAQILLRLRDFALENGLVPSCGCAINNIASQKCIEKSGFVSDYKLLSFGV